MTTPSKIVSPSASNAAFAIDHAALPIATRWIRSVRLAFSSARLTALSGCTAEIAACQILFASSLTPMASYLFTTFCGAPFKNALTLSTVMSMIR